MFHTRLHRVNPGLKPQASDSTLLVWAFSLIYRHVTVSVAPCVDPPLQRPTDGTSMEWGRESNTTHTHTQTDTHNHTHTHKHRETQTHRHTHTHTAERVKRFGQTVFFKRFGRTFGWLWVAASYWGRTIRRVFFCSKLLGKDHLLQQAIGEDYPQGLLLQQAIGEGPSAGSSFAASSWGKSIRKACFSQQAIGQIKFVISFCGVFFCSKLWVCPSPGLSFVRLLGKDHLQGLLLQQVIGEFHS